MKQKPVKPRKPIEETSTWLRLNPACASAGEPNIAVRRDPGGPGVFEIRIGYQTAHLYIADLAGALDEMKLNLKGA